MVKINKKHKNFRVIYIIIENKELNYNKKIMNLLYNY